MLKLITQRPPGNVELRLEAGCEERVPGNARAHQLGREWRCVKIKKKEKGCTVTVLLKL